MAYGSDPHQVEKALLEVAAEIPDVLKSPGDQPVRVVAPDLIGFCRSDKPADEAAHGFAFHREMLRAFVETLDLRNILLVCQDWGGLLGLTLPHEMPDRFTRLLVMNTGLGTGQVTEGFRQWRAYSNSQTDLPVGKLLARGKPEMTAAEVAAYDAPFPDARYKAALKAFEDQKLAERFLRAVEAARDRGAELGSQLAKG